MKSHDKRVILIVKNVTVEEAKDIYQMVTDYLIKKRAGEVGVVFNHI